MFPVATFFLFRIASEDIIFYIKLLEVAEFMCDVWVHHALLSLPDPYLMRPHLGSVGRNYGYFIQYTPDAGRATSSQIFVFMNDLNSASMTNDSSR